MQAQKQTKIMFYAFQNDRKKFFIPGNNNRFGPLFYDYVMIDSGCTTFLLPFPESIPFDEFEKMFLNDFWMIDYSVGTGALHAPILKIKQDELLEQPPFEIVLDKSLAKLTTKYLRFHLSFDATNTLLSSSSNKLDPCDLKKMEDFISAVRVLRKEFPKNDLIGKKRSYVLLGQTFFKKYYMIQARFVTFFINPINFDWEKLKPLDQEFGKERKNFFDENKNFEELEDADHEGDEYIKKIDYDD